jgi:hypothetical protein
MTRRATGWSAEFGDFGEAGMPGFQIYFAFLY